MKNFKSTLVFAIVVVLVGGFSLFDFLKNKEEDASQIEGQVSPFLNINTEDMTEVQFQSGANQFSLKKDDSGWSLTQPIVDRADDDQVSDFLTSISDQKVENVETDGQVLDWSNYGFDNPLATIKAQNSKGEVTKITVGRVQTFDQGYYFRLNEESTLYVGQKSWQDTLLKTFQEFQNKKFFCLKIAPLSSHFLPTTRNFNLWLKRGSGFTRLIKKIKIDQSAVKDFIIMLQNLRAESVVSDQNENRQMQQEFDRATKNSTLHQVQIEFSNKDVLKAQINIFSDKNNNTYIQSSTNNFAFKISEAQAKGFAKNLYFFRNKNYPFQFDLSQANEIIVVGESAEKSLTLLKGGDVWQSKELAKTTNQESVNDYLAKIKGLSISDFYNGTDSRKFGSNSISVFDSDKKEVFRLSYDLASSQSKNSAQVYIAKTNLAADVFYLKKEDLESILNHDFFEADKKP